MNLEEIKLIKPGEQNDVIIRATPTVKYGGGTRPDWVPCY